MLGYPVLRAWCRLASHRTPPMCLCREVGVQLILFGHDHKNCFHGTLEGVRLAYG